MRARIGLAVVMGLVAAEAAAAPSTPSAPTTWVVMPVRAKAPPPRDPTLLRLSVHLARAVSDALPDAVRLVKRDTRDRWCVDEGWRCPDEIATMLSAGRVVSLRLDERHARLKVQVFAGRLGVVAETVVKCTEREGRVTCDVEALRTFVRNVSQADLPERVPVELPL